MDKDEYIIVEKLIKYNTEIREIIDNTNNPQLQLDLVRVMYNIKIAIKNYTFNDNDLVKLKLKEMQELLEYMEHLIKELLIIKWGKIYE